ncbi:adenosylmethionine decarboxylase [Rummeliibacillus sp. G93]|uniref:S-adenosylmethionine decarboxylase proenzyme n=1 Tax=Rummeliibacillus stabekisii TaxID=241244 RepID=A0A143HBW9_9BACL|nr:MULTISPECIES: adenosylmethionine decarboxylase [Rummeliibacillus]AMW98985.1 S-adenosylmethionine decarboxylase proenzyme [Rummeliibacillus stabekisii]MBB5169322.1 S-adenosylmethionine decarboxylase [Rummeliibacillus stabekisii]MCM3316402.1 adenosylmethionine decarboxylase [Rummeliibacillus stabekisii]UQW98921.1 adenosylmethionine decarboxylase [Rummeliibacillus sp. G93]GEL03582.1 S-adenosylmethionine decarboxylase proenzyme [Rummeliibacillus stabekisii]
MGLELNTLGRHVLIELYGCPSEIIENNALIEQYMCEAADYSGATIVESVFHHFNPYGVSGAVIISESHLTIHTWPEYGFASVDVYTCGESVSPWKAGDYLAEKLKAKKVESFDFPRGTVEKIRQFANRELGKIQVKPEEYELEGAK